jgi:Family of unknown function (DUF6318)
MRLVRRRVLPLAAVALSAIVGLTAACTSGHGADPSTIPAPSGTPTTTPTVSPSPSRTGPLTTGVLVSSNEKPPVLSAAARRHDIAGAIAFVTYYYQALDWSTATTDPYLLIGLGAPQCKSCATNIQQLTAIRNAGGHITSGRIRLNSVSIVTGSFTVRSERVVEAFTDEDAIIVDIPGRPIATNRPAIRRDPTLVFVSWLAGKWQVIELGAPS